MKIKALIGSFALLLIMATTASALPFNTGYNTLNDTSAETMTTYTSTNTILDAGDILAGDIIFDRINDASYSGQGQLTAHFEIMVDTVTYNTTTGYYHYEFKSTSATDDTVAWFYFDTDEDATFTDSSTISDSGIWATFGLSTSSNWWSADTVTNDIDALLTELASWPAGSYPDNSQVGSFSFGLDVLVNNTYLEFLDVGASGSDLTGTGHFRNLAAGAEYPTYAIGDQANLTINVVPEPGSMLLLGTGLLFGAFVTRRRFNS